MKLAIQLPMEKLQGFCQRWQIRELAVFGSILREDFCPGNSDVDFLAVFEPSCRWSLLDRVRMERDLEELIHCKIDLLDREEVEASQNWIRRQNILQSVKTVYTA